MTQQIDEMMNEIRELAPVREHKLGRDMTGSRTLTEAAAAQVLRILRGAPAKSATSVVSEVPVPEQRRPRISDIPAGFYATPSRTGNNDLDFWKVIERKGGFRLVKRVIGGGTDKAPALLEIPQAQQAPALAAILRTGLEESERLFHVNTGRCLSCGAMLTDEESRATGRGPVCRNK